MFITLLQTLGYLAFALFIVTLFVPFFQKLYYTIYLCLKNKKDPFHDFYGMIGYAGYYGQGKSLGMSAHILQLRKTALRHRKKLRIYTNYGFTNETGPLKSLKDIEDIVNQKIKEGNDDYIIFALDELQNCLSSRAWNETKKFENLLPIFTMTRKLKVMFFYTSPVLTMSDKNIRISSRSVYMCKQINRFYYCSWRVNPVELEGDIKLVKHSLIPQRYLVLDDELKGCYDTYKFIDTLKYTEYLTHQEVEGTTITNINNKIRIGRKAK